MSPFYCDFVPFRLGGHGHSGSPCNTEMKFDLATFTCHYICTTVCGTSSSVSNCSKLGPLLPSSHERQASLPLPLLASLPLFFDLQFTRNPMKTIHFSAAPLERTFVGALCHHPIKYPAPGLVENALSNCFHPGHSGFDDTRRAICVDSNLDSCRPGRLLPQWRQRRFFALSLQSRGRSLGRFI